MCHYRLIISFALTCLIALGTKAQESLHYFFRHIDQSDGLLHNQVLSVAQDGKGFVWIATLNGLQRYDGSRFVYYPEMLSNPAATLTGGAEMYIDKKSNLLWISNNISIEKMDLGKSTFTLYGLEKLIRDPSFSLDSFPGSNNERWVLSRNIAYHYDSAAKTNVYCNLNVMPANGHHTVYKVTDSTTRNTWVVAGRQLYLFDSKNKTVRSEGLNPGQHPLLQSASYGSEGKLLRFIMIDSRKNIWVTTWDEMFYKYDDSTKKISRYSLSEIQKKEKGGEPPAAIPLINCMLEDDNHTIWVGTEHAGLLRYNREKDDFDYCITQKKSSESIRYDYKIFDLFQDKEQNIWTSTDKGISIFNPYRQYFTAIRHEEDNPLSICKSEIISFIQAAGGDMFVGTWGGGIARYDSRFNFKKSIVFKGPAELNFVWCFQQVDDSTLWIGCQHGWIVIYNMVTGKTGILHPPEMEGYTIRCMEKDNEGNIWFGLHNGKITKWDKKQGKFFAYGAGLGDSLKRSAVISNIFIDRAQHCWVSTELGFKEFDLEKRVYSNTWLPDERNAGSISGKGCQGIEEYNDSILLVGTRYGGLNFFNKKTRTFSHLNTADGLPSNSIFAIKKDTAGYVWFTTDYGLYKFNPAGTKFISYSTEPGVINSSFITNKFYPLQDGQWLTYSVAEAVSFFPRRAERRENCRPKVEITGFKLFDKPVFVDSLLFENRPVRLSYKENFLTVEFAALNFSSLQQTNYYYRLVGIDKEWVNGGTKRFASYTDLQPGKYVFDVKAENGSASGEVTSFLVIIAPPFWETWWFISIMSLCLLILIYLFVKWRIKNIKAIEAEKLKVQELNAEQYKRQVELDIEMYSMNEQLSKARLEALRSQMNPHFIFNCINSIDGLIQRNDKYHATVYLNKFAKLIRDILDSSKQNTVTLSRDLYTLRLYIELEQLRHDNKFTAEIIADDALLQDDYKVPPLIIQPFVENAILHGIRYRRDNQGKLSITVIKKGDYLQYTIEDNGVGRNTFNSQTPKEKLSYGIDMSNDRVKLFNNEEKASVQIIDLTDNGNPVGTKVEILLKTQ